MVGKITQTISLSCCGWGRGERERKCLHKLKCQGVHYPITK